MDRMRVQNLKSLSDSNWMELKPLTVFVGRNSSGKSSIVRAIPLLKQSTESKTLGTVLWSGKYVDYGSFRESVNLQAHLEDPRREISFEFEFRMGESPFQANYLPMDTSVKISIKVFGNEYSKDSYTEFSYVIFDNVISLQYDSSFKLLAAEINGVDFTKSVLEHYFVVKSFSLSPGLYSRGVKARSGRENIRSALVKELGLHAHHKTSAETLERAARVLKFGSDETLIRTLSTKALLGEFAAKRVARWDANNDDYIRIKNQVILAELGKVVDEVGDYLHICFYASRYITPLRAAADRYYRIQNTSIDELDPNGSNLAMFLHAKNPRERDEINTWLQNEIGFTIEIETTQGHASIFILDGSGQRSNIADTGFGFSQILPILIQMWQSSQSASGKYGRVNTPKIVVIEQPELHLHPKMQAQVGKMFCKAVERAKSSRKDLRVIIETHSRDIIESIGRSIESGVISTDDVSIYMVDKNVRPNVVASEFDKGGFLVNWPYGFFDGE